MTGWEAVGASWAGVLGRGQRQHRGAACLPASINPAKGLHHSLTLSQSPKSWPVYELSSGRAVEYHMAILTRSWQQKIEIHQSGPVRLPWLVCVSVPYS